MCPALLDQPWTIPPTSIVRSGPKLDPPLLPARDGRPLHRRGPLRAVGGSSGLSPPAVRSPRAGRTRPVVFQPVVFQPAVFQPVVFRPMVFRPVVFRPVVLQPAVFQPAEDRQAEFRRVAARLMAGCPRGASRRVLRSLFGAL